MESERTEPGRYSLRPRKRVRYFEAPIPDLKDYFELYKLPPEILAEIARLLDSKSQKAMSQVSHGIRPYLLKHIFESVRFRAAHEKVSRSLKAFVSSDSTLAKWNGYGHIRHATFVIIVDCKHSSLARQTQDQNERDCITDCMSSDRALPSRILTAIQSMSKLQSLHLDLEALSLSQKNTFLTLMAKTAPWNIPNLTVSTSWGNVLERKIIEHCAINSLERLQTRGFDSNLAYLDSATMNSQGRLTKLSLDISTPEQMFLRPLPVMRSGLLNILSERCGNLEWLVLNSKCEVSLRRFMPLATQTDFDESLASFIDALRRFRNLKRLGFTLNTDEVWHLCRRTPGLPSHKNHLLKQWYIDLGQRIGDALPQLESVYVTSGLEGIMCAGTRGKRGLRMAVSAKAYSCQDKKLRMFPFGVNG